MADRLGRLWFCVGVNIMSVFSLAVAFWLLMVAFQDQHHDHHCNRSSYAPNNGPDQRSCSKVTRGW